MQMKPSILVITDADKSYGVNHGFYKELEKPIKNNQVKVISYDNIQDVGLSYSGDFTYDGKDIFILNPYSDVYVKISNDDLFNRFLLGKSLAVKEVLVSMGAKRITVKDGIKDVDKIESKMDSNVEIPGVNGVKGSINAKYNGINSFDVQSVIESYDPNRKPKSYLEVKAYIDSHGLSNDQSLHLLLERLEQDCVLSGSEKYSFKCLQEIKTAMEFLSSLNINHVFSSSLYFSLEHNHIHEVSRDLFIEF